jgi:AraC family ethanolamine operon transcriptional activator
MVLNQQSADPNEGARSAQLSAVVEDASAQAAMQPWIEMECYQLGCGQQLALIDSLDLGSQHIVRESQTAAVQKLGVMPANLCTLSYCTPVPNFRFSDFSAAETDTVFFMPAHTEFDIYVPAGAQTAYVSLNQKEFLDGARTRAPAKWENSPEQLQQLQTAHQAALKHAINLWINTTSKLNTSSAAEDESKLRHLLLESILQVATATSLDDSPAQPCERARGFNVCRMARAFVEANLAVDVVPTVTDICRTIGVSERTLQYAFRAYVDMSPITYLRLCRLNRVRATLRKADPQTTTVTAVAMCFGFLHLGRFALDYRKLFNESPSLTLAN